jgi:anti-anti-sigma regulatory factor
LRISSSKPLNTQHERFGTTPAYTEAEVREMLRIHIVEQTAVITIYVEDRLASEAVGELRNVWESVRDRSPEKETVIDLCSVRTFDNSGSDLLSQVHKAGTRLAGNGLCIAPLIQENWNALI